MRIIDRPTVNTSWESQSRKSEQTTSRDYMLGSFFATILTAITDTKDWMALGIKTNPAYLKDSLWHKRNGVSDTTRTSR